MVLDPLARYRNRLALVASRAAATSNGSWPHVHEAADEHPALPPNMACEPIRLPWSSARASRSAGSTGVEEFRERVPGQRERGRRPCACGKPRTAAAEKATQRADKSAGAVQQDTCGSAGNIVQPASNGSWRDGSGSDRP